MILVPGCAAGRSPRPRLTNKHERAVKSAAAPNIHVEETLWELYRQEKARADHLAERCNHLADRNQILQTSLDTRRLWNRVKKLSTLKVGPKQ